MKIYTRTGDGGETSLFGGDRVAKNHPRIESYGTVDELNSQLGVVRSADPPATVAEVIEAAQSDLFDIGAHLASTDPERFEGVGAARIEALERAIDAMEMELEPLRSFILPGGCAAAAQLHVARTVCRRAERCVVALHDSSPATANTVRYLNRLSDFLFVAARLANARSGVSDVAWKKR